MLPHNEYLKEKEKKILSLILNYGKTSTNSNNKPNIVGTHILQASLDISFNDLYEDILSPQSTLQRIGRCDRFGNCIGESVIIIINRPR
jgi:CRISPR/Cas system-associated endonuclease/helicase Cas3